MIVDMTNVDVVIGIDPDNTKSGVGIVHKTTAEVQTQTATFSELLSLLTDKQETGTRFGVVIEGGWLTTSNWHTTSRMTARKAAAIGRSVGMNHQTGILLTEMCEVMGLKYYVVPPLRKYWRGPDGKITQKELQCVVGDKNKLPRMSQDQRDAVLLAWVYSGLSLTFRSRI